MEAVPVYTDQRPVIYDFPTCEGMDTSLQQCQLFNTDRNKRELTIDTCDFQAKLQCGGIIPTSSMLQITFACFSF